ncbi:MAG: S1 RNA-binding domain-containing protein [Mycoplasmataceae bacterium]|nr:S1 RNA-binding domain-containing protein [Mycoplasmataceae bacterium]
MTIGDIARGKVIKLFKTHFLVELKDNFIGLVHITEISDYFVSNITNMFVLDKYYDFLILEVEEKNKRVKLSWKRITPRYQIDPFESEIKETKNGFKNLIKFVEKEVEND